MARTRNYCLTLNNYTEEEYESLFTALGDKVNYLIVGKEVGESGTPHLQCYLQWFHGKTFSATKKLLGKRFHIEQAVATGFQNFKYCSKEGNFRELGKRPKDQQPGERNDLKEVTENIKTGKNIKQLLDNGIIANYQQLKYAETLKKYYEGRRSTKPTVKWYFGATGTGKTQTAYEEMETLTDPDNIYVAMDTGKWWDGYDGQEYIIIDDMRGDFLKFHQLLKLLDRYAYRVETKGSTRQFLGIYIIITSAYPPTEMFQTREDVGQLTRRIDEIREFK